MPNQGGNFNNAIISAKSLSMQLVPKNAYIEDPIYNYTVLISSDLGDPTLALIDRCVNTNMA